MDFPDETSAMTALNFYNGFKLGGQSGAGLYLEVRTVARRGEMATRNPNIRSSRCSLSSEIVHAQPRVGRCSRLRRACEHSSHSTSHSVSLFLSAHSVYTPSRRALSSHRSNSVCRV